MTENANEAAERFARAAEMHDRIITFDGHIDLPLNFGGPDRKADVDGPGRFDLVKAARGRLSGASLVVSAAAARPTAENLARLRGDQETRYAAIAGMAREFPDRVGIAVTPEEFRRVVAARKFAVVVSFQNALPLAQEIGSIDAWIDRGVRMFGLAFIGNNPWADSARPYPYIAAGTYSNGLSALGRAGVRRLNERGVIVDVSQLSTAALDDVLATTKAPVVASHSALRAFVDTGRNLSDRECADIGSGGGLVQIVGFAPYLRPLDAAMMGQLRALWQRFGLAPPDSIGAALSVDDPQTEDWEDDKFWTFLHEFHDVLALDKPTAGVRDLGAAIDHAVDVMGIDHVGVASDFNHSGGLTDWYDVGQSINVTAELIRRGYVEADIAKMWGENFLRVWQHIQDVGV